MATNPSGLSDGADQLPHLRLPLWVALALSVAMVGPTRAMSGNGQGMISTVGKAIPLVFGQSLIEELDLTVPEQPRVGQETVR